MKKSLLLLAAACPALVAASPSTTWATLSLTNQFQDAIVERISMAGPLFGATQKLAASNDLWVTSSMSFARLDRANHGLGYKSSLGSAIVGYDRKIGNWRVGGSLGGGAGSIKLLQDGLEAKFDETHWGSSLYGAWTGKKVNVIASLDYLKSKSDFKHGLTLPDNDASALSANLRFETRFNVKGIDFTPYYGVRFTHIKTEIDAPNITASNANLWQFPLGVNASLGFALGAWRSNASVDLGLVPTAGKKEVAVSAASVSSSFRYADSLQYQSALALSLQKGKTSFGLRYAGNFAAHGSNDQRVWLFAQQSF